MKKNNDEPSMLSIIVVSILMLVALLTVSYVATKRKTERDDRHNIENYAPMSKSLLIKASYSRCHK